MEVYGGADEGKLLLSSTEAYGSDDALTTTYAYDNQGRLITETSPAGAETGYRYDLKDRITKVSTPWGADGTRCVETTYRTVITHHRYLYRHYNPLDGRWTGRNPIGEVRDYNVMSYVYGESDVLGLLPTNSISAAAEEAILRGDVQVLIFLLDEAKLAKNVKEALIYYSTIRT